MLQNRIHLENLPEESGDEYFLVDPSKSFPTISINADGQPGATDEYVGPKSLHLAGG